MPNQNKLTKR